MCIAPTLPKELFRLRPDLKIFGLGGKRMQQAGVKTIYDIADTSVVGATEVISKATVNLEGV